MKRNKKKAVLAVLMVALLLLGAVGGTLAYLKTQTGTVTNVFEPAKVPSEVEEDFDGSVKENVTIRNNGNVPAYIRAAVVVTWKDASGNIYPEKPVAGTDYAITWTKTGWTDPDSNGFYYYKTPVAAGDETGELFTGCAPVAANTPSDYSLNVEILGQAIQSEGKDSNGKHPVELAWGVTVNNNGTPADYSDDTVSVSN